MSKICWIWVTALFIFTTNTKGFAQYDTIRLSSTFSERFRIVENSVLPPSSFYKVIAKKAFPASVYSNTLDILLTDTGFLRMYDPNERVLTVPFKLAFMNCALYWPKPNPGIPGTHVRYRFADNLSVNGFSGDSSALTIDNFQCDKQVQIIGNKVHELSMTTFYGRGSISITNNHIGQYMIFNHLRFQEGGLYLWQNQFKDTSNEIDLASCYMHYPVQIRNTSYNELVVNFANDTLQNGVNIQNPCSLVNDGRDTIGCSNKLLTVHFAQCLLNGSVRIANNKGNVHVIFDNCKFGPKMSDLGIVADTVEFDSCGPLPQNMALHLVANKGKVWIKLAKSSMTDRYFTYSTSYHLLFDSRSSEDTYTAAYENLETLFRNGGKKSSYETLDIEYRRTMADHKGWLQEIYSGGEEVWWNFGYSKGRVFIWAVLILIIFFFLNVVFWERLQEVYPVNQDYSFIDKKVYPTRYSIQKETVN